MPKDKNVKSENQSGGITAYNVDIDGDLTTNNEEKINSNKDSSFWKIIGYIALIATILSGIIVVLKFF